MTSDRIQPFCWKQYFNIGYFNGKALWLRSITERNEAIKIPKNHFCLIWNSQGVSSNKAIEEKLKPNFKVVNKNISDKYVKNFIKNQFKPKKSNLKWLTWLFMVWKLLILSNVSLFWMYI